MNIDAPSHALGIDISDGSLELASVHERRDDIPVLDDYGRVTLPEHVIVHGHIQDADRLAEALHTLIEETSIDPKSTAVVTALPDAQVLTKIIPVAHGGDLLRFDTIEKSAQDVYRSLGYRIKGPLLQWKYRELPGGLEGELSLYVARKESADQWKRFFKHFGMRLVVLEMESLALERSLIKKIAKNETVAIVDFGFRMTMVSIFDAAGLRYTHTISRGGFDITRALMQELDCSVGEAEQLKTGTGLTGAGSRTVHTILRKSTTDLLEEIQASLTAYGKPVTDVLITGGGARLRGIRTATEHALKLPTKRGISWLSHVHTTKGHLDSVQIDPSHTLYYTGAIGLAMRGMNRYTLAKGINFLEA